MEYLKTLVNHAAPGINVVFKRAGLDEKEADAMTDSVIKSLTARLTIKRRVRNKRFSTALRRELIKHLMTVKTEEAFNMRFHLLTSSEQFAYLMRQRGIEAPEIAKKINCSPGAARALISRACRQLGVPNQPPEFEKKILSRRRT